MLDTSRGDPHPKSYVICKPEVTVINRTESDDFIVIASKGLWDVLPNEIVCEVISQCLIGKTKKWSSEQGLTGACAGYAAAMLTLLAVARGSKDNISIIIVEL